MLFRDGSPIQKRKVAVEVERKEHRNLLSIKPESLNRQRNMYCSVLVIGICMTNQMKCYALNASQSAMCMACAAAAVAAGRSCGLPGAEAGNLMRC